MRLCSEWINLSDKSGKPHQIQPGIKLRHGPDGQYYVDRGGQADRFVGRVRRTTKGTGGEKGGRWCERIWTVSGTCAQQGQSVFEYLSAAVTAWFEQTPAPALLPTES